MMVDLGLRLADVNGDGLVDILRGFARDGEHHIRSWGNTGRGWEEETWQPDVFTQYAEWESHATIDFGIRLADVDGDGLVDVLEGLSDEDGYENLDVGVSGGTQVGLLTSIRNKLGGRTEIEYTPSAFKDNTGVDDFSDFGAPLMVVSKITTDNGMLGEHRVESTTEYDYSGGYYDYEDREFRGFAYVKESILDRVREHWFHQDDALASREYKTEVKELDGQLFAKTEYDWFSEKNEGVYRITLSGIKNHQYDESTIPVVIERQFEYDDYGNTIRQAELGDVEVNGDERFAYSEYIYNPGKWIMDKAKHTYMLDSNDNMKVLESWFYYDGQNLDESPVRGLLTKREDWLDGGENPVAEFEYDPFGNLIKTIDAEGRVTTFRYDGQTHTFKTESTNALGHTTFYLYDIGTGDVLKVTDSNGFETAYEYDALGRITKEIMPYDTSINPTKEYSYRIGTPPNRVITRQKGEPSIQNYLYIDGFGDVVQLVRGGSSGRQIITDVFYDELGRMVEQSRPYNREWVVEYTSPKNVESKEIEYDVLGRPVRIIDTDGSSRYVEYDRRVTTITDERKNKKEYKTDAYGVVTFIREMNGAETYGTAYKYDPRANLVSITDYLGNKLEFKYDSLGRMIRQDDPDMGSWEYSYDRVNNLLTQKDNRGVKVRFIYDDLDRVVFRDYPNDEDVKYYYDEKLKGTLSRIEYEIGSFSYEYDSRYRETQEKKVIDGHEWTTKWTYDPADRVYTIEYPGGRVIHLLYNTQGVVDMIPGILNYVEYDTEDRITQKEFHNEVVTDLNYDIRGRIESMLTQNLQDLGYKYDLVGNIEEIRDHIDNDFQTFAYDGLDRLIRATGYNYDIQYYYNALGNLMLVNSTGNYFYNAVGNLMSIKYYVYGENAGPHAVTSILSMFSKPVDADRDDFYSIETGGDDCDDSNLNIHPGRLYQVFYKDSLMDLEWERLGNPVRAMDDEITMIDKSARDAMMRFYVVMAVTYPLEIDSGGNGVPDNWTQVDPRSVKTGKDLNDDITLSWSVGLGDIPPTDESEDEVDQNCDGFDGQEDVPLDDKPKPEPFLYCNGYPEPECSGCAVPYCPQEGEPYCLGDDSQCADTICSEDSCGVGLCADYEWSDYPEKVPNFCIVAESLGRCTQSICAVACTPSTICDDDWDDDGLKNIYDVCTHDYGTYCKGCPEPGCKGCAERDCVKNGPVCIGDNSQCEQDCPPDGTYPDICGKGYIADFEVSESRECVVDGNTGECEERECTPVCKPKSSGSKPKPPSGNTISPGNNNAVNRNLISNRNTNYQTNNR
jgi:YD repeat-containing protein